MWPLLCSGPAVSLAASGGVFFCLSFFCLSSAMWSLKGCTARYESGGDVAEVDVSARQAGICHLATGAEPLPLELGQRLLHIVDAGDRTSEVYLRGDDVVVTYAPRPEGVSYQAYWRVVPNTLQRPGINLELILSVQTQSLDSDPALTVCSALPTGDVFCSEQLYRVATESGRWYLEMVHPSNHDISSQAGNRTEHRFFSGRLEKGVIRRARLRCSLLGGAYADDEAQSIFSGFVQSSPPLTT